MFSIAMLFFLLLLSYKLTLAFIPLTSEQQNTLHFLEGSEELLVNYTSTELSHLQDVQRIMNLADLFFYGSGVIVLGFILYFRRRLQQLQTLLKYSGITTVSFLLLFLFFLWFKFDFLFTQFHQLFFPQGNWIFPLDSWLIQIFPLSFFTKVSMAIGILTLLLGSLFIVLSFYLQHAARTPRN